jgi:inward rectifier potassium channel
MTEKAKTTRQRSAEGFAEIERVGHPGGVFNDVYAYLMRARWSTLLLLCAVAYVALNFFFATTYLLVGDCINGARPGSFMDTFSFSVQTLSTIGYGAMSPRGIGNVIVAAEALTGIICLALATGIVFNKFARPTSRVLFSRTMVVNDRNGQRYLSFRLANARGNEIVEASLTVTALLDHATAEGERMRRLFDLELERSRTPVFTLSWLVLHRLDDKSPLHGMDHAQLVAGDVRFVVSLTGIDSTFAQQVHARRMYFAEDIEFDKKFVDVVAQQPSGKLRIDLSQFHETEPVVRRKGASD